MKNRQMQFWRIVFTYVITYYHLNNAYGKTTSWYIGVEFFFIVSGFLLANKLLTLKENGKLEEFTAWRYTWTKYRKFFPHCLFSFLVAFAIKGVYRGFGFRDWGREFLFHIPEIFLVQMSGLNYGPDYPMNSPTWYLSVMLIVGYFIWLFMRNGAERYIEVVCPLSIFLIYPYLYRTYGFIGEHWEVNNFILNSAILRGIADMNLGVLACVFVRKFKLVGKIRMELISDTCLLFGGILMPYLYYKSYYDYLFTILIFIGVAAGFSGKEIKVKRFGGSLIDKWAMITPAIYLNHKVFRSLFVMQWPECNIWVYIVWFVFITVYSIFTYWLVGKIVEIVKKHLPVGIEKV